MWRVLVADDEKLICRLVQALVDWEALDMKVEATAENGLEALRLIEECHPDILITDIRMPGCNGLELIKQAKEIRPDLEIVIISGYAHFEYAQNAMTYGVGNYILKPINQQELQETLVKIRGRLDEREKQKRLERLVHTNSRQDLNRLREGMIKDILERKTELSFQRMHEIYHFMAKEGMFQAFVLKMDYDRKKMSRDSYEVIVENVRELYTKNIVPVCTESLLACHSYSGYGVLNYLSGEKDAVRRQIREFLNQLEGKRYLLGDVTFSIALGSVAEKPEGLTKSMEDAKLTAQERIIEGCGRILEGVPEASGIARQSLMDKYVKTVEHAIEVLSTAEAYQADDRLYEEIMAISDIRGREVLDMILAAGKFFLLRTGIDEKTESYQAFELQCMQCETTEALIKALKELQSNLISELEQAKENESSRPIRMAKKYIMQNFHRNISLEEVCEHVGFSAAYFSAMFKKETGEGFAKYLMRIRMEEAKQLLRETGIPVAEICEKVGYNDRKHFTHTFHKYTGVNPAEYRKLYG